ncbi:uncharacterized protein [Manis javanica]|uniref:uncharacterized protein n=1 Tax=Manis javanica TaxID=9974 RepID=UPI003C6D2828
MTKPDGGREGRPAWTRGPCSAPGVEAREPCLPATARPGYRRAVPGRRRRGPASPSHRPCTAGGEAETQPRPRRPPRLTTPVTTRRGAGGIGGRPPTGTRSHRREGSGSSRMARCAWETDAVSAAGLTRGGCICPAGCPARPKPGHYLRGARHPDAVEAGAGAGGRGAEAAGVSGPGRVQGEAVNAHRVTIPDAVHVQGSCPQSPGWGGKGEGECPPPGQALSACPAAGGGAHLRPAETSGRGPRIPAPCAGRSDGVADTQGQEAGQNSEAAYVPRLRRILLTQEPSEVGKEEAKENPGEGTPGQRSP